MKKVFLKSLAIGLLTLFPAMSWAQISVPHSETFEGYSSGLPADWSKVGSGTVEVVSHNAHGGSKSLKFSGSTSNIVAMPAFSAEISTLQLTFWTKPEGNYSSCGTFEVGYLTNPTDQFTFHAVETYSYSDNGGAYSEKVVTMPSAPAGSVFAFKHIPTSTSYYWFVDDIQVVTVPTCIRTANITVSNVTDGKYIINGRFVLMKDGKRYNIFGQQ